MKRLILISFSILGAILLLLITYNVLRERADIKDGVTGRKIREIKPGFSLEQVESFLGKPFEIEASQGLHERICKNSNLSLEVSVNDHSNIRKVVNDFYANKNYCCDGNKEDLQMKAVTLTYSKHVWISKSYPMLWIHLDSNFKVYGVYAKKHDGLLGLEDPSIYSLSWVFDVTTMKMKNEVDYFIDERKFEACFE